VGVPLHLPGQYREAVIRSLITLKALTFQPTGGIVAAATTSLPEDLGGVRNWDYRYCWLRDATITLEALLRTGYTDEASAWRAWLARAVAGDPGDVQIMYGVAGERRLDEWEADWLPGYESSAPVRIGNAAVNQRQLDVRRGHRRAVARPGDRHRVDRHAWSLQRARSPSWKALGRGRTRESGRSAARGGTSCTQGDGLGGVRPRGYRGQGRRAARPSGGRRSGPDSP
jgi:GH15 family glucan-1,4-alpha-glucosidase